MAGTAWAGTIAAAAGAWQPTVVFAQDPATGAVTAVQVTSPVAFTPNVGYAPIAGASFTSTWSGSAPTIGSAWALAQPDLLILMPGTAYNVIITS